MEHHSLLFRCIFVNNCFMKIKYLASYRRIVQRNLHNIRSLKSHSIIYNIIVQQMNKLYLSTWHVLKLKYLFGVNYMTQ